jgi:flagellar biogenesis protein FliO
MSSGFSLTSYNQLLPRNKETATRKEQMIEEGTILTDLASMGVVLMLILGLPYVAYRIMRWMGVK